MVFIDVGKHELRVDANASNRMHIVGVVTKIIDTIVTPV